MQASILTIVRVGPCVVYALAATSLISVMLLASYPSSALIWALYLGLLPTMRELISVLLAVSDVALCGAIAILAFCAIIGVYLAIRPERYLRARFIHAHVALGATVLTMVRAADTHAGFSGPSFPQLLRNDWSLTPITDSLPGMALLILVFFACLCSHVAIIRRICA